MADYGKMSLQGDLADPTRGQKLATFLSGSLRGLATGGQEGGGMTALRQQRQALDDRRKKALVNDAMQVYTLLNQNEYDQAIGIIDDRIKHIDRLGGDPSDTLELRQMIVGGKLPQAKMELETLLTAAQQNGLLEAPAAPEEYTLNPGDVRFRGNQQIAAVPGTTPEGFEMIPPQEAAQMGLPPDKQYQRNTQTRQVSQIGAGPAVQVNTGNPTEGERTAGILANRLDFAQSQINEVLAANPQAAGPGALPTALSALGMDYLARVSNPAERQIIEAAQDDMLDAALTLGTGAAYTAEQFRAYKRSYFPQLGDDEQAIKSKAERLTNLLNAAYTKAGRGAPEQRLSTAPTSQTPSTLTPSEQQELAELRARYGR